VVATCPRIGTESATMVGDVNCDGAFDQQDASAVSEYVAGSRTGTLTCPQATGESINVTRADVNGDGEVTVSDALLVAGCSDDFDRTQCPAWMRPSDPVLPATDDVPRGMGDVNCDGIFDRADAIAAAELVTYGFVDASQCDFGSNNPGNVGFADLDRNRVLTFDDVGIASECVAGLISSNCPQPIEPECLSSPSTTRVDQTWTGGDYVGRIRPGDLEPGVGIDLRGTTISVHTSEFDAVENGRPVVDSRWGLVQMDDSTSLCVAGGQVLSPNPSWITWAENYDTDGIGIGYRLGTTRNHTAIDLGDAIAPIVSGMSFFNVHDGPRFNGATDWRLEHSWGEYTRDDCVENDEIASGVIYDTLFDGCYTGYSNRATSEFNSDGEPITGIGKTVTFDRVLLRMERMPGPHKACERTYLYYDVTGAPFTDTPCADRDVYGTGPLFKLVDQSDPTGSINPTFDLIDSVFVVEPIPGGTRADFPPESKIGECRGVVIVYLGELPYPGRLPPPDCYTLLTGDEGRQRWARAVAAWHVRHPEVGTNRKQPATYGDITFPRPSFGDDG